MRLICGPVILGFLVQELVESPHYAYADQSCENVVNSVDAAL